MKTLIFEKYHYFYNALFLECFHAPWPATEVQLLSLFCCSLANAVELMQRGTHASWKELCTSDTAICSQARTKAAQKRSRCSEWGCSAACYCRSLCICFIQQTNASGMGSEAPLTSWQPIGEQGQRQPAFCSAPVQSSAFVWTLVCRV